MSSRRPRAARGSAPCAPLERFARVSGARSDEEAAAWASAARALFAEVKVLPGDGVGAAVALRRHLGRVGFRYDVARFTLDEVLAHRAGNCLGITLLVGAELAERGFTVEAELRVAPKDATVDATLEHLRALDDPDTGVDFDSRLPGANDRSFRFRFVPLEHAALRLVDAAGRARTLELTSLDPNVDPFWGPPAEDLRVIDLSFLAASVVADRAKRLVRADGSEPPRARAHRQALRLALAAVRAAPDHREAWAQLWRDARSLALEETSTARRRHAALADEAARRYRAIGGNDSLFHFTAYRMTGDPAHLDRALAIFPAYVEAYFEREVVHPLVEGIPLSERERVGRAFILAAWCVAECEVLDLQPFYLRHRRELEALFSPAEWDDVMATFAGARD